MPSNILGLAANNTYKSIGDQCEIEENLVFVRRRCCRSYSMDCHQQQICCRTTICPAYYCCQPHCLSLMFIAIAIDSQSVRDIAE